MELLVLSLIIVCSVLLVICTACCIMLVRDSAHTKIHLEQQHTALGNLFQRMGVQDQMLNKLGIAVTDFINTASTMLDRTQFMMAMDGQSSDEIVFKTKDGKYSASTFDDLIQQIKNAGQEDKYLSDTDLDDLRKMFEDTDDDDEDDSDAPQF